MMLTAACTNRKFFPNMEDIEPFNVIYQTAEDGMEIRLSRDWWKQEQI